MSTCPEKDLHSIYLDGEMPEKFAKEYEAHLETCEKCRRVLEKMRTISNALHQDCNSISLDSIYLDQSFERLQTKLQFSKNTQFQTEEKTVYSRSVRWIIPFAAAAAVFAVIFTPLQLKNSSSAQNEIKAIARNTIKPISEKQVVVDGNISITKIAGTAARESISSDTNIPENTENISSAEVAHLSDTAVAKTDITVKADHNPDTFSRNAQDTQKVIPATSLVSGGHFGHFDDIDVFRPDFNNSPASVRIDVPDMHTIPMNQAGHFEGR